MGGKLLGERLSGGTFCRPYQRVIPAPPKKITSGSFAAAKPFLHAFRNFTLNFDQVWNNRQKKSVPILFLYLGTRFHTLAIIVIFFAFLAGQRSLAFYSGPGDAN